MSGEFGTGKTIFVLAIVVGCFAVLWPKIFYPMLTASVKQPAPARQEGPHARPERPAHLYPEMVHPALREKGRAMPQRTLDKQARPGPMPGVRPPMGGAGGIVPPPQSKGSGAMGIIMPLYTVGIVVFFVYTIMKVLFKKGNDDDKTPKLKDFGLDPEYRKYVFAEEYLDNADVSTRDQIRRQQREDSRSARRKHQPDMQQGMTDTKIGARVSRTQGKMDTKGKKLGEWYLPEGFLTQSLDQDSDTDLISGGASINQSAQETYRDRLLEGLRATMQESLRSQGRRTGTNQDILNLLKEKYGFDMDLDEEEEEDESQYEEPDLSGFSSLRGEASVRGTSDPRHPLPTRQYTLDLSELRNEHPLTDEGKGESESDVDDPYPSKGFQARHNTLNLSEFQEEAGLPQDQCSPPGFLEALEEGLRRRKVTWRLSSEDDSSPGSEEHQEMGASENLQQEPKVGDSPEVSECCGEDRESDAGSSASQTPPHPMPSSQAHTEDLGAEQAKTDCDKKDEQLDHLRRRLEETERAMERLMSQMGSVTDKLTAAKITEVLSQAQFQAKILKEEVSEITSEEEPSSEQFTATLSEDTSLPTSLRRHLQELQVDQLSSISEALYGEVKQLQDGGRGGANLRAGDSTSEEEPLEEDQVVVPELKVEGVTVLSSPATVDTSPPLHPAPQGEGSTPGQPQGEAPTEEKASPGVGQGGAAPEEGHTDVSALREALSEGDKARAQGTAAPGPPEAPSTPPQAQEPPEAPAKPEEAAQAPAKATPPTPKEVTFKLPSYSSSTSATGDEEGPSEATETGADISDFVSFAEENHTEEEQLPAQVVLQEDVPEVVYKAANAPQDAAVGTTSKGTSTQTQAAQSTEHSTQTDKEREIAVMGLDTSFHHEKDAPSVPPEVPEILLDALLPSETQLLVKDTKDTNVEIESSEAGVAPCIVTSHVSLAILGLEGGPSGPIQVQTASSSTTTPQTVSSTSAPQQHPAQPTSTPANPQEPASTPQPSTSTASPSKGAASVAESSPGPTMVAPLFTSPSPVVSTITANQFVKEKTPERTQVIKETPQKEGDSVVTAPFFAAATSAVSTITADQFNKEKTPERTKVIKETPQKEGDAVMVAPLFTAPAPVVSSITADQFMKEKTPERTQVIKETPKKEGDAVVTAPFFTAATPAVSTITFDQFIKEKTPERTQVMKETPQKEGDSVMAAPFFAAATSTVSTITADQFIKEKTPERTPVMKMMPKKEGDAVIVAPLFTAPAPVVSSITADQFMKEKTPERTQVIKETPKKEGDAVVTSPFFTAATPAVSTITFDQFSKEKTPERMQVMKETPQKEGDSVMAAPFFASAGPAVSTLTTDQFTSEPTPPTKTVGGEVVGEPPAPAPSRPAVEAVAEAIVASTTRAALDHLASLQDSPTPSTDESSASTVLEREAAQERVEAALAEAVREEASPPAPPVRLCGRPLSPA